MAFRLLAIFLLLMAPLKAQQPDFDQLVKIAKRHDLVFPPKSAKLALAHTGTWTVLGNRSNSRDPAYYTPAFVLEEKDRGSARVLIGGRSSQVDEHNDPALLEFSLEVQKPKPDGYLLKDSSVNTFICAVQCAERGDLENANKLWKAYAKPALWDDGSVRRERIKPDEAEKLLTEYLLRHHLGNLTKAGSDWEEIHRKAMAVTREFPDTVNAHNEQTLRSLEASVKAKPPKPGSVEDSTLAQEDQIALLEEYAQVGSLQHRRPYLQTLAGLDGKRCAPLVIDPIRALPKDVDEPYWTCKAAKLTHVVMQIEHDGPWRAYLEKAKTCSIGLRMEMMNPMDYLYIGDKNKQRRLAFLAAFLGDEEVRKVDEKSKRWEGPHAGFHFDVLSVQNFVAMQIGGILETPGRPNEYFTAKQWEAYREEISAALTKHELPDLE